MPAGGRGTRLTQLGPVQSTQLQRRRCTFPRKPRKAVTTRAHHLVLAHMRPSPADLHPAGRAAAASAAPPRCCPARQPGPHRCSCSPAGRRQAGASGEAERGAAQAQQQQVQSRAGAGYKSECKQLAGSLPALTKVAPVSRAASQAAASASALSSPTWRGDREAGMSRQAKPRPRCAASRSPSEAKGAAPQRVVLAGLYCLAQCPATP